MSRKCQGSYDEKEKEKIKSRIGVCVSSFSIFMLLITRIKSGNKTQHNGLQTEEM